MSNSLTDRDIDMRRMHGDFANICAIKPDISCCIDSLEVRKKTGGHWIIRDLAGLDLVGLASL